MEDASTCRPMLDPPRTAPIASCIRDRCHHTCCCFLSTKPPYQEHACHTNDSSFDGPACVLEKLCMLCIAMHSNALHSLQQQGWPSSIRPTGQQWLPNVCLQIKAQLRSSTEHNATTQQSHWRCGASIPVPPAC
jgi:hypothetical protein